MLNISLQGQHLLKYCVIHWNCRDFEVLQLWHSSLFHTNTNTNIPYKFKEQEPEVYLMGGDESHLPPAHPPTRSRYPESQVRSRSCFFSCCSSHSYSRTGDLPKEPILQLPGIGPNYCLRSSPPNFLPPLLVQLTKAWAKYHPSLALHDHNSWGTL